MLFTVLACSRCFFAVSLSAFIIFTKQLHVQSFFVNNDDFDQLFKVSESITN